MGRRKLFLTTEIFVEFAKATTYRGGFSRRFLVIERPLPDDTRVVGMNADDPFMLQLILESDTWEEHEPMPVQLPPVFQTVFDEETK